ncbi:hypothetical protein [Flagellimonas crocea]|uniref:hypothetical protein n=1 Tax=Flagellimonas crocea TaxID=3067311 RepID=UPI00296E80F1|nr:hypothetical protein [Muricauda sp. DH64]
MQKTLSILICCSILFLNFSCKQKQEDKTTDVESKAQTESAAQMEKIIAIHDEVMPKMRDIGKLVGELKPKVDSTAMGKQYEVAMKDLQDAHKTMMDWMREFGDRFDYSETMEGKELSEQKQQWLDEEEEKVKVVKEKINGSIERAEKLLNSQNPNKD